VTTTCKDVLPLIDELVDGTLDDARSRAVRAHLRACPTCAARESATRALVDAVSGLERPEPPSGLWRNLAARLDDEEAAATRPPRLWWWWHAWRRSILAGGGALAAAGLAFALFVARDRQPVGEVLARELPRPAVTTDLLLEEATREVARAERDYRNAIEELRAIAGEERLRWSPEAARAFDENLAVIDAAIDRQAAAFRGSEADPAAADGLHASYQRKIDFLQEAILRGSLE
jgi:hypothetical protein